MIVYICVPSASNAENLRIFCCALVIFILSVDSVDQRRFSALFIAVLFSNSSSVKLNTTTECICK